MENVQNPVEFVAPELWDIIFANLHSFQQKTVPKIEILPSDLYSCYRTCTTFRNILEPTKSAWLFYEVVPFMSLWISGYTLLRCREICKSWKLAVDNFLEKVDAHVSRRKIANRIDRPMKQLVCSFTSPMRIAKFISAMDNHPRNPFPGRNLELYLFSPSIWPAHQLLEQYNEFRKDYVNPLLARFGQHVYHLRIDMFFDSGAVTKLKALLALTPNLQSLHLRGRVELSYHRELNGDFPQLEHLTSMYLQRKACGVFPASLQRTLTSCYMNQLKRLQISFTDSPHSEYKLHSLQNLENLELTISDETQLELIFPLENHNNCLKYINIKIIKSQPGTLYTLANLFLPLRNLKYCLENLVITTARFESTYLVEDTDLNVLLLFEKLKHLHLQGFDFTESVILCFLPTSLESLTLNGNTVLGQMGVPGISLDIPSLDLGETRKKVWCELPKLRKFAIVDFDRGCRHNYCRSLDIHRGLVPFIIRKHQIHEFDVNDTESGANEDRHFKIFKNAFMCAYIIFISFIIIMLLYAITNDSK